MMLLLLACTETLDTGGTPPVAHLEDPLLVRRMSLDLRGTWPTREELSLDPEQARDAFLEDPRFEERLVVLFGERWYTLVDEFNGDWYDFGLERQQEYAFQRAIGEEPLRLAAHLGATDQPWSRLTTADHTMANPLLAELFPLEQEEGEGAGGPSRHVDRQWQGRLHDGIVALDTEGRPS